MSDIASVIAIGRGRGDRMLNYGDWAAFRSYLYDAVTAIAGGEVVYSGEGTGQYLGESEASFVIIATGCDPELLRTELVVLTTTYHQDSIALIEGGTEFLEGTP